MGTSLATYEEEKASGRRGPTGALRLSKLSGKHLRIIALHCAGLKGQEIAAQLGATGAWISTVLNDPLAKAEIHRRFVELDNEMFVKATQVVDEKMRDEDPAIALRAAEMVWRARGRFEKKAEDRPTAEDVVQRMLELARDRGSAEVTIRATAGQPADRVPSVDPLLVEGFAE